MVNQACIGYNLPMRISSRLRQLTIWLACLALLVNVLSGLLPAMAGGMASGTLAGSKPGVVEVCSVEGVKLIDAVTGKLIKLVAGKPGQDQRHMAAHCAYCLPHAGHDFVLPGLLADVAPGNGAEAMPPLFYLSSHILFIWIAAQPRGPPISFA
ncbi:hypothetical protein DFR42_109101 [Undibacterium pigrum]|uniref:DUF2946 family protein n=2 Tax=Undibacterium pigrum TaxID=401470 RepID=A0A318IZV0_9BURK|nr:hypothetical protein DFR42_109101 [Undibacterium pigrum]